MANLPEELTRRLERLARSEGMELLAVEVTGPARRLLVRLTLDREDGGVTLADCETVSRQASVLFDAHDPFPGSFTLEVSSPGLDRKLYRETDYERYRGRGVRIRMLPTWTGGRAVEGFLEDKAPGTVRVRDLDDEVVALPEEEIFEVRLAPQVEEKAARRTAKGRKGPGSGRKKTTTSSRKKS